MAQFHDRTVQRILAESKAAGTRVERAHGAADGLRVRANAATDAVSWVWYAPRSTNGKRPVHVLGSSPAMTAKEAAAALEAKRTEAKRDAAGLPGTVEKARAGMTLRKLLALFWWRKLRKRRRSWPAVHVLRNHVLNVLGPETEVRLVRRENVEHVVERLVNAGKADQAVKVLALMKQMFDVATRKPKAIDTSPAEKVSAMDFDGIETNERDVALTPDGLGRLWRVLHDAPPAPRGFAERRETTRLALVILLATGRRTGELVQATWDHFDLGAGIWNVPPEVRKLTRKQLANARTDVVRLPPQAVHAVERLRLLAPSSPWVLASPAGSRTGHVAENAISRALKDMQRAGTFGTAPLGHDKRGRPQVVRPHDFRRSLRSVADEKTWGERDADGRPRRPSPMALELVLGHTLGDKIMRTYNLATFDGERAAVLRNWCDYLDGLAGLTVAGVVNLDAARGA